MDGRTDGRCPFCANVTGAIRNRNAVAFGVSDRRNNDEGGEREGGTMRRLCATAAAFYITKVLPQLSPLSSHRVTSSRLDIEFSPPLFPTSLRHPIHLAEAVPTQEG